MNKLRVDQLDVKGKRVFVRVDFNVPLSNGEITDDTRIRAALPTIKHLLAGGARVVLASHLGRPKGGPDAAYSLRPVATRLSKLLGQDVPLLPDCVGPEVENAVNQLKPGQAVLLENLRFHPEEEKNGPEFARGLASLADVYVDDAFGAAHRAHASISGVPSFVQPAAAGFLLAKEIEVLGRALESPERPFVTILGGSKVSDKIAVIENLLPRVDRLIIGGGMANTFLKAKGLEVGKSLLEPDKVELAQKLIQSAGERGVQLVLPVDAVVAPSIDAGGAAHVVPVEAVPVSEMMLDIGPRTVELFGQALVDARLVLWNGPMGVFEKPAFAGGTNAIAKKLAGLSATTIIGGGDSAAAVEAAGVAGQITHISTGGGASLEFLEGRELPGVAALTPAGKEA
jgi:phosphoglycerate kinase